MALIDYHKSITQEIISTSDRVRNLVTHWGEEGRYKEEVFKNILKRFLPDNLSVGTGFVLNSLVRNEHDSTNQIDVIIYDNSYPVLFKEADFVIIPAEGVRGIIEVKANLLNQDLKSIIDTCNKNGKFIHEAKRNKDKPIFNGIFSFKSRASGLSEGQRQIIRSSLNNENVDSRGKYGVNHIAISKDSFIKYWGIEYGSETYSQYNLIDLSFSFFISNLIDYITDNEILKSNFIWFAENKENKKEFDF